MDIAWLADTAPWWLTIAAIATTMIVFRRRAPAVSRGLLGGVIGLVVGGPLGMTVGGSESGFVLGFLGGALVGVIAFGGAGLRAGTPSASPRSLRRTAVLAAIAGLVAGVAISALFFDLCGSDPADGFFVCQVPAIPLALVFAQPAAFVALILGSAKVTPRPTTSRQEA